ncbi:MAG: rod shape-determining protein MreD [bacterium]|nr:rod shape-determining protein MreD [bacterium]
MKSGIVVIVSFCIISLMQVSFLPHLSIAGWTPNIVLLFLLIMASFTSVKIGIEAALTGGFFLDLYSYLPFGSWIVISLVFFITARYILRNYVRLPQYI